MSKVASITIRLEIQADAPFIKFEFVDSNVFVYLSTCCRIIIIFG
uniref:Uncharacterized protein n=1 Tax=Brugia timori TaxID=42155 RepID=A0A0R3Q781_9BILA